MSVLLYIHFGIMKIPNEREVSDMSIAIGAICIFTIITLRDELLIRRKQREFEQLQALFCPHEDIPSLEEPNKQEI